MQTNIDCNNGPRLYIDYLPHGGGVVERLMSVWGRGWVQEEVREGRARGRLGRRGCEGTGAGWVREGVANLISNPNCWED